MSSEPYGPLVLTLFKPMEFSIKLHTKKSRWSIEGSQVIISKKPIFVSLKIDFVLTSNANPDEITHEVIKLFPCSTHMSTKFILRINVKMPTIVGILTFISRINTTSERLKARNFFICRYFSFYEQL